MLRYKNGGATRDRTADLLNAIQALSQLSYSPIEDDIVHDEFRRCISESCISLWVIESVTLHSNFREVRKE